MNLLSRCSCFVFLLVFLTKVYATESLTAYVDRQTIGKDETLQLTLRYSGNNQRGEPDFSNLEKQFEIISSSTRDRMQGINGRFTSYTDWVLIILPREEGKLVIPSFSYGGQISDALEITVNSPKQAPTGGVKNVFIETVIEQDSVYVQQQILVKYRLYFSVNLDSVETEPLEIDNVLKEVLPESRYTRAIGGKRYSIAEFNYALFPQTSGEITIPSLTWDIKIPKSSRNQSYFGFSGRYEISRQRTDAKTISVKPRPDAFPKDMPWIPATDLKLTENWSQDPEKFKVGEPATRTLTLVAEGLMGSQLPQIWQGYENEAIKSYADQPELSDDKKETGVSSTRVENAAVVMAQNGSSTLPAIRLPWWDIATDSLKYAEIPERTLSAVGGVIASSIDETASAIPSSQLVSDKEMSSIKSQLRVWQLVCVLLLCVVAGLAFLLRRQRPNSTETDDTSAMVTREKTAWAQLKRACDTNAAADIRATLLQWASCHWPNNGVKNLSDIATKVNDDSFTEQTLRIDSALYSKASNAVIDGNLIISKIQHVVHRDNKNDNIGELQSFYATS